MAARDSSARRRTRRWPARTPPGDGRGRDDAPAFRGGPLSAPPRPDDAAESYREFRHPLLVLVLATGTAGALDSFAFLRYGAFVANQSGNAVFLGIGPAGQHPQWPASAASLVAFTVGAGLLSWLRTAARRWPAPVVNIVAVELAMALWAVLNVLLAYGRHGATSRAVLAATGAFALGGLTTLISRTAGIATSITYQSGTTAKTGEYAARWLADRGAGRARARFGTLLGLLGIASYAAGGAVGALAQRQPHWVPLWGALVLATLLPMVRREDHRP